MLPVLSVSEFIDQINGIIAGEFEIEGEISQYKISQGKWIFFDLKDERSVLNCFSTVFMLRAPLEDGMKVRVFGYPKIHEKSGRFSLTVQGVQMVGEGALKRAYELLKRKLEAEGIFNAERKRALPRLPKIIGVIASKESAAFGDFTRILNNRWGGLEIIIRHVLVQGEGAVADIHSAFDEFDACKESARPDVIALVRGGGSLEDLAAFNSEEVARAVYNSRIPVITGIGHERDVTLAELAADVRASTPSNAAEMLVPDRSDFFSELSFGLERMLGNLNHNILRARHGAEQSLYLLSSRLEAPLAEAKSTLNIFANSLNKIMAVLSSQKAGLDFARRMLANFDPRNILHKGYSITRNEKGKIIRRAGEVGAGDDIVIELSEGIINATAKNS
jgi:exodeoxyribonuclease VII large subunit